MDSHSHQGAPLPARFEALLLERISAHVGEHGGVIADREAILARLREVLEDPRFDAHERLIVAAHNEAGSPGETKDAWLAARVQRALAAGLSLAAEKAGLSVELLPPRVVVRRSSVPTMLGFGLTDGGVNTEQLDRTRDSTLVPRAREHGVLVLADAQEFDLLLSSHPNLTVSAQRMGAHFVSKSENVPVSVGTDSLSAVQVHDLATALRRIDATMSRLFESEFALLGNETLDTLTAAPPVQPDTSELVEGTLFHGKYSIVRCIGRGGFGTVYEARDVRIGSRVAIKLLNAAAASNAAELDQFVEEARRVTRLEHPHIVGWKVFDEDEHGRRYFVMELLEGEELERVLTRETRLAPRRVALILLQIADALRAAHLLPDGDSILHLDLKPKNVFLLRGRRADEDERVKVIDFGIGQFIGGALVEPLMADTATATDVTVLDDLDPLDAPTHAGESMRVLTDTVWPDHVKRVAACTPEYASPEQCTHMLLDQAAQPLDGRADLYSLGVIGFQLLTGELPFPAPRRRRDYLRLHRNTPPRKVSEMGVHVPRALARFITRCLEKKREDRWRDAQEAYDALYRIVHPSPLRMFAQYGLPLAAVAAATVWALWPAPIGRAFDLYATIDGVEHNVETDGLWLGPARSAATLRLSGAMRSGVATAAELLTSLDDDALAIPSWRVAWLDDEHIVVDRPASAETFASPAYVRLRTEGEPMRYSAPFELHWLAADSWDIANVSVRGLGSRRLDPAGQTLEVRLRGASDVIVAVDVSHAHRRLEASLVASSDDEGTSVYGATLDDEAWTEGPNELRAVVVDRAGLRRVRSSAFDIALEPLVMSQATLAGERVGGRYALSGSTAPALVVALNRSARLDWRILDSADRELADGASEPALQHALVLPALGALGGGRTFSGTLELRADEGASVAHARIERGRVERRLPFVFHAEKPELVLRLVLPGHSDGLELVNGAQRFVALRSAALVVTRVSAVPVEVEIALEHLDQTAYVERRQLSDPAAASARFELPFPVDGVYRLVARAYRMGGDEGVALEPEFTSMVALGVDTSEPSIVVEAAHSLLRAATSDMPAATLSLSDDVSSGANAPVDLRWALERIDARTHALRAGNLSQPLTAGESRTVALPLPWSDLAGAASNDFDGRYLVGYSGRDAAGNEACAGFVEYEIALHGPTLQLRSPTARLAWSAGDSGAFEIEVLAQDPNDTAAIEGELVQMPSDVVRRPFTLERVSTNAANATLWRGRVVLDPSWSETDVVVRLSARDGQGAKTAQTFERRIGSIERRLPEIVRVRSARGEVASLALVRGNREVEYVFGGRADADEDTTFRAAGLGRWRTYATGRSWQARYAPREIPDYYLDQREVSAGEMLAFVRDDTVWSDATLWPEGQLPDHARRAELEAALAALDAADPASGVTWSEANAFAQSIGKRLPSHVEWEYAVRGGARYRPFFFADGEVRSGVAAAGPSPVERSLDDAWSNGLRDLCGNVAEWTGTPAWFPDGGEVPRNPALHVAQWRAQFLDARSQVGWDGAEHYWVVGGSWRTSRCHFFVVDRQPRDERSDAVGFRCAASADAVVEAIENPHARVGFEEVLP